MPPKKKLRGTEAIGEDDALRNLNSDLNFVPQPKNLQIIPRALSQGDLMTRFKAVPGTSSSNTGPEISKIAALNAGRMSQILQNPSALTRKPAIISSIITPKPHTHMKTPQQNMRNIYQPNTQQLSKFPSTLIPKTTAMTTIASGATAAKAAATNTTAAINTAAAINTSAQTKTVAAINTAAAKNTAATISSTIIQKMDYVVSCLNTKFDELSKQVIDLNSKCDELASNQQTINESIQKLIIMMKNERKPASIPSFLPFRTVEEITAFDDCNIEEFNDLVRYLTHVGEPNISRCASIFLNKGIAVQGEILDHLTWQGVRNTGLKTTKFFEACTNAINTLIIPNPLSYELNKPFENGLKALKEQLRRQRFDETGGKQKKINVKTSIISGKGGDYDKENDDQNKQIGSNNQNDNNIVFETYLTGVEGREGNGEPTDPIMNMYVSEVPEEEVGAFYDSEQYPLIPENGLNAEEENELDPDGSTMDSMDDLFD
ncbi:hypothetical protein TKK_0009612 [Trichogramma kaykai]|uniref:DUF4806 domain-containing protein n=1 Tax=Trichogramma kaykai TaxID=54128 RepID=A0ABD2X079_9HYME